MSGLFTGEKNSRRRTVTSPDSLAVRVCQLAERPGSLRKDVHMIGTVGGDVITAAA